jgi:hypothetical protein
MSYGQAPFQDYYPSNSTSLINTILETTANESDYLTFVKSVGNGKRIYVNTNLRFNPSTGELTGTTFTGTNVYQLVNYLLNSFGVNKWKTLVNGNTYELSAYNNTFPTPSLNGTVFSITDTGLISIIGSGSGLRLFDRTVNTNYWDTQSTASVLTFLYNAVSKLTLTSDGLLTTSLVYAPNVRITSAAGSSALEIADRTSPAVIWAFYAEGGASSSYRIYFNSLDRLTLSGTGNLTLPTGYFASTLSGFAVPVLNAVSTGTKLLMFNNGTNTPYAIGVEPGNMWFACDGGFKWYNNATVRMTLSTAGNLTTTGYISNGSMVMFNNGGANNYLGISTSYATNYGMYVNGTTTICNGGTYLQFRVNDNGSFAGEITSSSITWNYPTNITTTFYSKTTAVNWNSTVSAIPAYNNANTQYRLIALLPEINDGGNGMTMTVKGSFGYYGNGNDFTITIANRGGYAITVSSQGTATITNITNNVDLRIYRRPSDNRDFLYIVIKPFTYPWFDFYVSARDYAGTVYLPTETSWTLNSPVYGTTVLYSSVLQFCSLTNTGNAGDLTMTGRIISSGDMYSSSGNVGCSNGYLFTQGGGAGLFLYDRLTNGNTWVLYNSGQQMYFYYNNDNWFVFIQGGCQQIRHTTAGGGTGGYFLQCLFNGNLIGGIYQNSNTTVSFPTSSDRRLKTDITDITNSGEIIDLLKPRNFTWITDNKPSRGFIADELQQVLPDAVMGEPNAVDAEGKPVHQMIDPSGPEMIALLVAELQSLRRRVLILENKIPA